MPSSASQDQTTAPRQARVGFGLHATKDSQRAPHFCHFHPGHASLGPALARNDPQPEPASSRSFP